MSTTGGQRPMLRAGGAPSWATLTAAQGRGAVGGTCKHRGMTHRVYLVGGPARVGKSALAQRLLLSDGIQWLPTDVLRTVLRRVLPELDELD